MLFSHVILGFAVTVAAIDIRSHYSASCSGKLRTLRRHQPETCWGVATAQSLAFVAIPFNRRIECRGYSGGNCANRRATIFSNGRTSVCVESGNFLLTGGVADDAASQQHKCTSRQKPDAPVLEDGSEYDVSGLEEDSVLVRMWCSLRI